jgi:hypothetical protein
MSHASQVKVKQVDFKLEITEPVGPLSAEDVQKIANMVLDLVDRRHQSNAQREQDTRVRDRVWDPEHD